MRRMRFKRFFSMAHLCSTKVLLNQPEETRLLTTMGQEKLAGGTLNEWRRTSKQRQFYIQVEVNNSPTSKWMDALATFEK